jgi:hypothetical protein
MSVRPAELVDLIAHEMNVTLGRRGIDVRAARRNKHPQPVRPDANDFIDGAVADDDSAPADSPVCSPHPDHYQPDFGICSRSGIEGG